MYYVLPCRESLDDFIFVTVQGVGIGEGVFVRMLRWQWSNDYDIAH